jgi:hypothetical protein
MIITVLECGAWSNAIRVTVRDVAAGAGTTITGVIVDDRTFVARATVPLVTAGAVASCEGVSGHGRCMAGAVRQFT